MKAAKKEPKSTKRASASGEKHVERVRRLCLALPETCVAGWVGIELRRVSLR